MVLLIISLVLLTIFLFLGVVVKYNDIQLQNKYKKSARK